MAKTSGSRPVQCYHCRAQFDISARAMTVGCPKCYKQILIEDVVVKNAQGLTKLQTCGRIIIEKRGRVKADLVEAHEGIEIKGYLEAKTVSGAKVILRNKATLKGDLRAPSILIEQGATITRGFFEIAGPQESEQLGLSPLPGANGGGSAPKSARQNE